MFLLYYEPAHMNTNDGPFLLLINYSLFNYVYKNTLLPFLFSRISYVEGVFKSDIKYGVFGEKYYDFEAEKLSYFINYVNNTSYVKNSNLVDVKYHPDFIINIVSCIYNISLVNNDNTMIFRTLFYKYFYGSAFVNETLKVFEDFFDSNTDNLRNKLLSFRYNDFDDYIEKNYMYVDIPMVYFSSLLYYLVNITYDSYKFILKDMRNAPNFDPVDIFELIKIILTSEGNISKYLSTTKSLYNIPFETFFVPSLHYSPYHFTVKMYAFKKDFYEKSNLFKINKSILNDIDFIYKFYVYMRLLGFFKNIDNIYNFLDNFSVTVFSYYDKSFIFTYNSFLLNGDIYSFLVDNLKKEHNIKGFASYTSFSSFYKLTYDKVLDNNVLTINEKYVILLIRITGDYVLFNLKDFPFLFSEEEYKYVSSFVIGVNVRVISSQYFCKSDIYFYSDI